MRPIRQAKVIKGCLRLSKLICRSTRSTFEEKAKRSNGLKGQAKAIKGCKRLSKLICRSVFVEKAKRHVRASKGH
jgi:hypothetical protein